jgi:Rrf2 family protein
MPQPWCVKYSKSYPLNSTNYLALDKKLHWLYLIPTRSSVGDLNQGVITRATEYAIRAILYLAKQPAGEIVYKKDICQNQDITPAFLTKIFQPLIKAGIVGSQRGVGGGFYLVKNPADISLLDVIRAEEGPLYLNHCLAEEGSCNRDATCSVHDAWRDIREEMLCLLGRYTFAKLVRQEKQKVANQRKHSITPAPLS